MILIIAASRLDRYICNMFMRYIFVIITLTGLLLQTFGKGLILAEYMLNREYISRVLCVNRAEPETGCNGQCHLMKQMEKETKNEQNGNAVKDKYEVVIAPIYAQFALRPYFSVTAINTACNSDLPLNRNTAIFHPPRA